MGYFFFSKNFGKIYVEELTDSFCKIYCKDLLDLINIIPHIHWSHDELLSHKDDLYGNKWNYSYVVKNSKKEIIGVLIAYFRMADNKHIFDSLYIHKFAIAPQYQMKGIGTEVLNKFIQNSFAEIPWLLNISVQTNLSFSNEYVIRFYKSLGFKEMYNITYPDKTDLLLLLERDSRKSYIALQTRHLNLKHPRFQVLLNDFSFSNKLPIIYFSSTNEKKKQIVKFIFHNYNIEVEFVKSPIELTEPQIEKPDLQEERKLVSLPLKAVSRFLTNTVPYVIEDTMLFIEYFNRNGKAWELPGLDTKRWLRQMGLDGLLDIMGATKQRRAKFVSQTGAYLKSNRYVYGRGEITGTIAYKKATVDSVKYGTYPHFFHLIFIPDGANKTLAEMDMHEFAQYDYMRKSIVQLIDELSGGVCRQFSIFDFMREEN